MRARCGTISADFVDQILILFSILYSAAGYNLEYNIYTYTIAYLNIPRAFSAYHFPICPRSIFRISNISQAYCYILLYIVIILGDMAIYCVLGESWYGNWGKSGRHPGGMCICTCARTQLEYKMPPRVGGSILAQSSSCGLTFSQTARAVLGSVHSFPCDILSVFSHRRERHSDAQRMCSLTWWACLSR